MRSAAPPLLPIFRSKLQADILAATLLNPDEEFSLSDLAKRFDAPLSTIHGEVNRLTQAALLSKRSIGRATVVRANINNRLVEPLTELLFLSWGPLQVVADEFTELPSTERVLIFGSWAARFLQWPGPPPHDLDVLVIGNPPRSAVYDASDQAQRRLGMPVNPVIRTPAAWLAAADQLVQQIQAGPMVVLLTSDDVSNVSEEDQVTVGDDNG
ncbi:MAG TPA: hypothetical protein VGS19_07655 [Streptosporangiaceae bacterium]|nr:hypothetical protein [Streptosporangiaceae bacterium]